MNNILTKLYNLLPPQIFLYYNFHVVLQKKGRELMTILDKIMKPKSIAVVGASTKEHTIGSDIMKRLQEYNFNGKIYPVNPKGGIIEGLQAYTSVLEIPGEVDLAIIVVNAKFVLSTIDRFFVLQSYKG